MVDSYYAQGSKETIRIDIVLRVNQTTNQAAALRAMMKQGYLPQAYSRAFWEFYRNFSGLFLNTRDYLKKDHPSIKEEITAALENPKTENAQELLRCYGELLTELKYAGVREIGFEGRTPNDKIFD